MRPVNLLPESQRRRPQADGRRAYLTIAALAVLAAMTGAYVLTSNQVAERTAAADAAAAEADRLEAEVASLGAFGDFAQIKQARVASVRQLAAERFDWERLMLELARVLPADGWLQAASASVSGDLESEGAATGAAAGGGGPVANLTGCLPRQPDVAELMLRLRRMHRVEDVTLSESVLEDEGGPPSIDSCGRYYKFDVEVAFAPTLPTEAPDGERRVPASLGGGS